MNHDQGKGVGRSQPLWLWISITFLCLFCLGMGSHQAGTDSVLTIEALYRFCNLPLDCDARVDWEGETVKVSGRLDPANIFSRQRHSNLPYEKFRLIDDNGRSVEVWPEADDNNAIFNKLFSRSSDMIIVTGRLEAVKLPISSRCRIGIKVVIDHEDQIEFR